MFRNHIESTEIEELPLGIFEKEIIVVHTPEEVAVAVAYLSQASLLGFDTETRPSFVKGKKHKVALLQLATADRAYLFRLASTGIPASLAGLLESGTIMKVGAAIRDDLKALQKVAPFLPFGFIDLQAIVGKYGIQDMSVRKMAAIVLDLRVSKSQQLSNWENTELTEAQQRYAATDAWVCREIYIALQNIR